MDHARLFRKAQEALTARDEFLSMASHDLRSPLSALRLQLHALRKELQPGAQGPAALEKTSRRVETMERQIDRMLHMMDALMDISQMTAGRLELKRLNREVTGYGVGLWIVRRVVEAHGGSMAVKSRLGDGSTFIVRLPLRPSDDAPAGRTGEPDPEVRPPSLH